MPCIRRSKSTMFLLFVCMLPYVHSYFSLVVELVPFVVMFGFASEADML